MSSRLLPHATLALLLATPAVGFAPAPTLRGMTLRPADLNRALVARAPAVLDTTRRQPQAMTMSAAATVPQPQLISTLSRVALLLFTSLVGILVRALPAFAVTAARRTASSAGIPVGDVIKYGGVVGLLGAAFVFRREEVPILTETPMEENTESSQSLATAAVDDVTPPTASIDSLDDSSLNSMLVARMQQLAKQDEEEPDEVPPPSADDSSDTWGVGDTAVLERPSEEPSGGLLDGEPAVEFPTGFPLVDAEWETEPSASEADIAMLQRMFGGSAPPAEDEQ